MYNKNLSTNSDMREVDRLHFLEFNSDSVVLQIGGVRGWTTFLLSGRCKQIFELQHVGSQEEVETFIAGRVFDAIIVEEPVFLKARDVFYKTLIKSLKNGGEIYIAVQKRKSFRFVRNIVSQLGLQDAKYFIILPNHHTPMFFLPLYHIGAIRYFFHNLFYLVTTVPPEKRGKYKFIIGMVSAGVKMFPARFLMFLLRTTFLSRVVIARKI